MSASLLELSSDLYSFQMADAENDTPLTVEILNQSSNTIEGSDFLSFYGANFASSTLLSGFSTFLIKPSSTTFNAAVGQTINFDLRLTDSQEKTRTYSSIAGDFDPIIIQDAPVVEANNGKVYVYISTFGNDNGLQNSYLALMGINSVDGSTPPEVIDYNSNDSMPVNLLRSSLGDSPLSPPVGTMQLVAEIDGLETLDSTLASIPEILVPNAQSCQIIVLFPKGSDMTVPTSIHDSFNSVAGGAVPCINSDNNGFAINTGTLHEIRLIGAPVDGFTEWFMFGRTSQNSISSTFKIRLVDTDGELPT